MPSGADAPSTAVLLARYRELALRAAAPAADVVERLLGSLDRGGRWPDIDYGAGSFAWWDAVNHLDRLRSLARAWAHVATTGAASPAVLDACRRALGAWVAQRYQSPNWWFNRIGVPQILREALILLDGALPDALAAGGWEVVAQCGALDRPGQGANQVWLAESALCLGAQRGDGTLVAAAASAIAGEIRVGGEEGLQADSAYLQHGRRHQSCHYGAAFAQNLFRLAWVLRGTPWALSPPRIELLARWVVDGLDWMRRGSATAPGTLDRMVSRPGALAVGADFLTTLPLLRDAAPEHAERLDAILRRPGDASCPRGFRHWRSADFTAYHRDGFSFFLKTISTRTLPSESINGENLAGYLLNCGDAYVVRDGGEHRDLMPVWDWSLLPGVTHAPEAALAVEPQAFVGACGDGASGVTAFACGFAAAGKPPLRTRSTWFCHGDLIVRTASIVEGSGQTRARTVLDQCRRRGPVVVGRADGSTVAIDGEHVVDDARWLHHDGNAFILLAPGRLRLRVGRASGSWRAINAGFPDDREVAEDVVLAVIEHAVVADAAYAIAPAATAGEAAERSRDPGVRVLAGDGAVHAVRFADGAAMAAFYAAAPLAAVAGLAVDAPCLALLRDDRLLIADPAGAGGRVHLAFDGVSHAVDLPRDGEAAVVRLPHGSLDRRSLDAPSPTR